MAEPFLGEIRIFGGSFAPAGWAFCDGQLLVVSQNNSLFNLIGVTYGGDGVNTFGLPDLRGRVPIHKGTASTGTSYVNGETGGVESVTLTTQQIPVHTHPLLASTDPATDLAAVGSVPGGDVAVDLYASAGPLVAMSATTIGLRGGSQPHENMQPFLCINFIIALEGVFPTKA